MPLAPGDKLVLLVGREILESVDQCGPDPAWVEDLAARVPVRTTADFDRGSAVVAVESP